MSRMRVLFIAVLISLCFVSVTNSMDYYHFELHQLSAEGYDFNVSEINVEGHLDIIGSNFCLYLNPDTTDKNSEQIFVSGKIITVDNVLYLDNNFSGFNTPAIWDTSRKEFSFQLDGITFIFRESENLHGINQKLLEIDYSGYTYNELLSIRKQIEFAFWFGKDWEKVTVPIGVYEVGVDIPEGHWSVETVEDPNIEKTEVSWGEYLSDTGENVSWAGKSSVYNTVYNPNYKRYNSGDTQTQYSFEVYNGDFIVIKYSPAVFKKYVPKSLGFK